MMTMITWWCLPIAILRDVWNVDRIVWNPPKSPSFGHPEKLCKADVRKLFGWLEDYVDLPNQRSRTAFELEIYFISFIFFPVCCFLHFFVDISHRPAFAFPDSFGRTWEDLLYDLEMDLLGPLEMSLKLGFWALWFLLVSWFYKGRVFQPWMLVKTFRAKTSVASVVLPLIEVNYCYDRSGLSMVE